METIVRGACPHDCPDTCSFLVTVRDGVAVSIRGNPDHPHTRGALCVKVNDYLARTYHPDRLLYPQKRVGQKGSGQFARISWDEAIGLIVEKWQAILKESGGGAILPYSYSGTLGLVQNDGLDRRFFNRLGACELERTICSSAGEVGVNYSIGARLGADPEMIPEAKLALIWGANPASTHPHYLHWLKAAQKNGAMVILIDPRHSRTAPYVDWHLMPYPGTDAALALGMMRIIVDEELADFDYIREQTISFDQLRERLEDYPLERVADVTRLAPEDIVRLSRLYATTKPAFLRLGYGPQRHGNGGMTHRTIALLPAIVGQYGVRGGGFLWSTSSWLVRWDNDLLRRPELRQGPARRVNMIHLGEELLRGDPPIRSLYVFNANPATSNPGQGKILAGLRRDDLFTVVHEIFPTDTADYADILLPATTQLERWDLHMPYGSLYLGLNTPAIAPLGESKSNTEVFRLLPRAMGFTEPALYDSDEEVIRQMLAQPDPALAGITFEKLQEQGWARLNLPSPAIPFADGKFPTPSGKVEFYSKKMADAGYDPLPAYVVEAESPAGDPDLARAYPLYLITPGAHRFLNSTFANVPRLAKGEIEPTLEIHPNDAQNRGIADGDWVEAFNDRGRVCFRARLTEKVTPGVVATTTSWWQKASPDGQNVNHLISDRWTDMGRGPLFYNALVEVEKVGS